jgi:hypothetical protein
LGANGRYAIQCFLKGVIEGQFGIVLHLTEPSLSHQKLAAEICEQRQED